MRLSNARSSDARKFCRPDRTRPGQKTGTATTFAAALSSCETPRTVNVLSFPIPTDVEKFNFGCGVFPRRPRGWTGFSYLRRGLGAVTSEP